ncbi:hypothetical protein OG210_21950 [Streptomyces sp. NBC_00466]|uniref:hypothetical protein n=1 Tax=Streptomyces sp. NBC_00466 TaxID=2903655 RepID=UPI0030E1DA47
MTAYSEWQLALQVGVHPAVAPLFPAAIDVYLVASVRAGRGWDIAGSLAVMGGCQVSAHLLTTHSVTASVPLVAAVSLLIPITVWRVHSLAGNDARTSAIVAKPELTVNVIRAGTPPWKPATPKAMTALQPPALRAVSALQEPRPDVVTARVSTEPERTVESPPRPSADQIVRELYEQLGEKRPGTRHIRQALEDAGLPCSDGSCRQARLRVEQREPQLKELPPA